MTEGDTRMFKKFAVAVTAAGAITMSLATSAFALDCHNISRNVSAAQLTFAANTNPALVFPIFRAPDGNTVFWNVMPMFKGNWYLLAITEVAPENQPGAITEAVWWGFIPPGSVPFFPGGNGNYTNGKVDDLLGISACPMARQVYNGIQSGACGGLSSIYSFSG